MFKNYWIIALAGAVLLLCIIAALAAVFASRQPKTIRLAVDAEPAVELVQQVLAEKDTPKLKLSTVSKSQLKYARNYQAALNLQSDSRVIILPHQISEGPHIAGALDSLPSPSAVFVLAPDTSGLCGSSICTTDYGFETVGGGLRGSPDYVAKLQDAYPALESSTGAFAAAGPINYLLPFIAQKWAGARVIPIIVNSKASEADTASLSTALNQVLKSDSRAILIAATQADRDLPLPIARFHDQTTIDVIQSLADLESHKTDINNPEVLGIALKTARKLKLGQATVESTTATSTELSSSYFYAGFAPGEIQNQDTLTLAFLGDIMLDRFVAERSRRAGFKNYPFVKIAGPNNEFFHGQDMVVANLEGPVTARRRAPNKGDVDFMFDPEIAPLLKEVGIHAVSQANNHTLDQGRAGADESRKLLTDAGLAVFGDQVRDDAVSALTVIQSRGQKVALLGFNITDNPLNYQEAEDALKSAYEQARYVVVYMHWGAEYQSQPNMTQIELAHWFIDQGVDAVIGAHPHWMQSVEVYNNRPIIYSLGNFIFDQDWSRETNYGLIAGLTISPDLTEVQLHPIQIKASQPFVLQGEDRQTRLDRLANISHESLKDQIKTGQIKI
ncbi:AmmeMemoRadiSam system protein B, partial [Candidatus Uhrbacteria bacterium]|nr:AmmeMemoRadiSam system protein B [Candidatus Uhrbacteria bacterium]